jgi:hypothetical protein
MRNVDRILAELAAFTDEQRSLAWSPQPPYAPTGPHDCRSGGPPSARHGACGVDFNLETARARWLQARFRWSRENGAREGEGPL